MSTSKETVAERALLLRSVCGGPSRVATVWTTRRNTKCPAARLRVARPIAGNRIVTKGRTGAESIAYRIDWGETALGTLGVGSQLVEQLQVNRCAVHVSAVDLVER
jgi:hypothetical protein